jgi:alkanesulfonate monooxygenase SsuD/methylene tetrahydromethanopterin reductase-like flavin-dependent oxidoreductase (luciferase family)
VILPLDDPIWVAEDAAFVVTIGGGRLQLGLGTGGDPLTFSALGKDVNARRELYAEGLRVIRDAFAGKPLNGTEAVMYPPAPTVAERIWEATFSVEGGVKIGEHGNGLLLARTSALSRDPADVVQEPIAQAYVTALAGRPSRVGMSRSVYAAADKATALAHMESGVAAWAGVLASRGAFPTDLTREETFARMHIHYGAPEEVAESLQGDRLYPFATEVIVQVQPGAPTKAQTLKSLELVARDVAPALGWQPVR